ncbi:hypothetical protein PHJA_001241400 [Phtheirospermum japonicum]|uniref:Uncharacterized protein n=1 Tax=Phtheirospermum japonicum TaxID=374723 RepID=A0A830C3Y2_9LAMI|nr:hypothetical protein PHJA_001241400 [Phtheirospermum japonicum]
MEILHRPTGVWVHGRARPVWGLRAMATARFGNFTLSTVLGGLLPLFFNIQVHGFTEQRGNQKQRTDSSLKLLLMVVGLTFRRRATRTSHTVAFLASSLKPYPFLRAINGKGGLIEGRVEKIDRAEADFALDNPKLVSPQTTQWHVLLLLAHIVYVLKLLQWPFFRLWCYGLIPMKQILRCFGGGGGGAGGQCSGVRACRWSLNNDLTLEVVVEKGEGEKEQIKIVLLGRTS